MIKHFVLCMLAVFMISATYGQNFTPDYKAEYQDNKDTVKLKIESTNAYYQHTVKVDSGITEGKIYIRTLQFMAGKNFQQNYGYEEEGKLICTTTQDLNTNIFSPGGDNDAVDPFTVQFAITVDMKNMRYRYTVNNVVFYLPTEAGNRRLSLDEMYKMATNGDSRSVARAGRKYIISFEAYLSTLTGELYEAVIQKQAMSSTRF